MPDRHVVFAALWAALRNAASLSLPLRIAALLAVAAFLVAGAPVRAFPGLDQPSVSIAAERGSYGFGFEDVVFRLTRAGSQENAFSVRVSLSQDHPYLATDRLNAVVRFAAGERETDLHIRARRFNGPATQSGVLRATLVAAFGYTVGHPDSARTRMVVADPAITIRPEQASYTVDRDDGEVRVTFVARTAADVPRPGKTFSMAVSTKAAAEATAARREGRAASRTIEFKPGNFVSQGGKWEARKAVSVSMREGDEGLEVMFQRAASTSERIRPRNSDGSACTDDVCMVPVFMTQRDGPTLTIAAGSDSYGYEIDNVVFTVTRTGTADSAIGGSVTMTQDDTYLPAESLSWTFTIPANETTVTHTISWASFSGGGTQTGDLTATLDDGDDYEVGAPDAATVEMVVLDPAITVRPEKAAYSFDEDDAAASVTFVARTAPGLPQPNAGFDVSATSFSRTDGAQSPDDYADPSTMVRFEPADFTASGSEWEARKEIALSIVDDGEDEGDETFDLRLQRSAGQQPRIGFRQADGSVCQPTPCTIPVTLSDPREVPALTIAAGSDTYGYQIDNVVFTVTRTGTADSAIGGSVTMTQDDTYLPARSLTWTFTIPADQTTATHTLSRSAFSGGATQTGDLTATLDEGDDYDVGTPGAATVEMVVANPAITVRPEHAAYGFDEDDASASVVFIARTAPGLPRPGTGFSVSVSARERSDGAGSPDDYAALSELPRFAPGDFAASGSEWEARKAVALTLVDDGEAEGDETFDLLLEGAPGLSNRIKLRQADGTVCPVEGCLTPVTLSDPRKVPVLTIAAERKSYGYGIDDIGFVVTAAGTRDGAIEAAVTLTQDDSYLQQAALSQTVRIEPHETSARLVLTLQSQTLAASQTGTLTATIDAADGYQVGMPGSATVSMVVLDPAITVRPERAAYRFVEGQADAKLAYVARTERGLPKPNRGFDVLVVTSPYPGGASIPADLAYIQREVEFEPGDFILRDGGHWVARKEVALAIVDDEEQEPEESLNMLLLSSNAPPRVQIRQTERARPSAVRLRLGSGERTRGAGLDAHHDAAGRRHRRRVAHVDGAADRDRRGLPTDAPSWQLSGLVSGRRAA